MNSVKKTIRVTITKEFEIELTPAVFAGMSIDEYLAEFRKGLWHVDNIDDVLKYAARCAANGHAGAELDGIGLLNDRDHPRPPDVKFREIYDDCEEEVVA